MTLPFQAFGASLPGHDEEHDDDHEHVHTDEELEENANICLDSTGYPCETDADCDGVHAGFCETYCDDLMKVCYFVEGYDTGNFKK